MKPAAEATPRRVLLPARHYDLNATLASGQTFQFVLCEDQWEGVIGAQWVRLSQAGQAIQVEFAPGLPDLDAVADFLQCRIDLKAITRTFPKDAVLMKAIQVCEGLRLLKQDPWQCLASFILSSTKQIVQIEQLVRTLSERYGARVPAPREAVIRHAFPSAKALAVLTEQELRQCKLGFRAPYLLGAARAVHERKIELNELHTLSLSEAREHLMSLHGVGRKIADCALLFSGAQPGAFPVDVWIARALRRFYFDEAEVPLRELERFTESHFGIHAGYAQQYLFHYTRVFEPFEPARSNRK